MSEIIIKNLNKSYGNNKVINEFNIKITDGEFIVLVGPSGCGKSTLLRMISGLETVDKGEIFLNNNINVEFVSANPTGPLHVGHVRGAVIGDVLSNILKMVGYNVTKEYYINDAGNQIDVLAASVFIRYEELITKNKAEIPEGYYPGENLIPLAKSLRFGA